LGLHCVRFLLAFLHTDSLSEKRTLKDVKSALRIFGTDSTSLDSAYIDTIRRIEFQPSGDVELAKNIIFWITLAKQPLTCDELRSALAIKLGTTSFDLEALWVKDDLTSVCAGLVIVDRESKLSTLYTILLNNISKAL
jgi:hypothetical protein